MGPQAGQDRRYFCLHLGVRKNVLEEVSDYTGRVVAKKREGDIAWEFPPLLIRSLEQSS